MGISLKPLSQQVMVITGASSGIGLATALAAAQSGARLVLAARSKEGLEDAQRQVEAAGGEAIHVVADVSQLADVQPIALAAIDRFGGFDTWFNNAGVSIIGPMREVSDEDSRAMFDTNFWGLVYGSLEAVKHLKQRGGALINMGSLGSDMAIPLQGMYSASKHAVKGFTDALRMELEAEQVPVSITLIKPTSINTPFPHHARNYLDCEPKLPSPVYDPKEVAAAVLHAATHGDRDVFVGGASKLFSSLNKYFPRLVDWLSERMLMPQHTTDEPARNPLGSLYQAGVNGDARGDHPGHVMKNSLYTRASLHPVLTGLLVGVAGMAAVAGASLMRKHER